jgi:uncharacterized membrane protein YcaP (DUF421 family)
VADPYLVDARTAVGVAAASALFYAYLLALLRLTGNRTLANLRAFDVVVTVALGTLLGSTVLSSDVPLAKGLVAVTTLVLLQVGVAWATARSPRLHRTLMSPPRIVLQRGREPSTRLREANLAPEDVRVAMRAEGVVDEAEAWAVVLEPTGDLRVLRAPEGGPPPHERDTRRDAEGFRRD